MGLASSCTVLAGSPADFGKLIASETEKRANVVKFSGAKPDDPNSQARHSINFSVMTAVDKLRQRTG